MSTHRPVGAVLTVAGGLGVVGPLVARLLTAQGWRVREVGPGRFDLERGSRPRTVLRGAFAGAGFHLAATVELRELSAEALRELPAASPARSGAGGAVEVRLHWGAAAGRRLGGTLGRARALREHRQAAEALARQLAADGRAVDLRFL